MKYSMISFALLATTANAFTSLPTQTPAAAQTQLSMSAEDNRRSFISKAAGVAAAAAFGLVQTPEPAQAIGSLKKVNAKLAQ